MSHQQRKDDDDLELSEETSIYDEERGPQGRTTTDGASTTKGSTSRPPPPPPTTTTTTTTKGRSDYSAPRMMREVRRYVAPLLPPPVLRAMEGADRFLTPYVGDEGSFQLVGSALLAYGVLVLVRWVSRRALGRGGLAVRDDEADELQAASSESFEWTVLLCGPPSSGKTRLFYQLCFADASNVDTVASIKANVAIVDQTRYMDWPGCAKLSSPLCRPVLVPPPTRGTTELRRPRIVVVLDATQPVAPAADCLHQLFSTYHQEMIVAKSAGSTPPNPIPILVLCHKSDLPSAKNEKRLQLQLRGELERLLQSQQASTAAPTEASETKGSQGTSPWWPVGEPLDLSALPFATLLFRSSTCEGKGCTTLVREFCQTGTLSGQ